MRASTRAMALVVCLLAPAPALGEVAGPPPSATAVPAAGAADRDHDGVPDALDACPDRAGPAAPGGQRGGCPLVRVESQVFRIMDRAYFTEYSARIDGRALTFLRQVADTLRAHPEITRLTIEGHTDEVEQRTQGRRDVSLERARAVREWLVAQGIDPARLEAVGLRSTRPRGPNDTRSQRTLNRRVEFRAQPPAP